MRPRLALVALTLIVITACGTDRELVTTEIACERFEAVREDYDDDVLTDPELRAEVKEIADDAAEADAYVRVALRDLLAAATQEKDTTFEMAEVASACELTLGDGASSRDLDVAATTDDPTSGTLRPTSPPMTREPATPSPTPSPPPMPTERPVVEPEPMTFSGTGKSVTDVFSIAGGITHVTLQHTGTSNFAVWLLHTPSGDREELFVNDVGNYGGSTVEAIPQGEYVMDVEADGGWTIEIRQPRARSGEASTSLSGQGDEGVGPVELEGGLRRFRMTHDGSRNFAIWLFHRSGDRVALLVNEAGPWEGETAEGIDAGVYWFDVTADGNWTIDIS